MRFANLAYADVGVGEDTLKEALKELALHVAAPEVVFSNVSRNNELNHCETKYWWDYVQQSVPEDAPTPHYFALGTGTHDGCEVLLQQHAKGHAMDPKVAAKAARDSVAKIWPDTMMLGPKDHDERLKFDHWHEDVLAAAAKKFELIEKVHMTEELVWALVPMQETKEMLQPLSTCTHWVVLMGRVDAVVELNGETYHLQHKTTSKVKGDYETYVTGLGFSGHETVYGWILTSLIERKQLDAPAYAGSVINMLQKRGRPNDAPDSLPKGLYDLQGKGKVRIEFQNDEPLGVVRLEGCTDKQWETAERFFSNWSAREECRVAEIRDYDESVAQFIWADLDQDKMVKGILLVTQSVDRDQRIVNDVLDPFAAGLRQNHQACVDIAGRPCPRLESATCGGWEEFNVDDPDSGWALREPDYVNAIENWWHALEGPE